MIIINILNALFCCLNFYLAGMGGEYWEYNLAAGIFALTGVLHDCIKAAP